MRNRGFEKLNEFAILPKRSTSRSAGYDFFAPSDGIIKASEVAKIKTNVCAYMHPDEFLAVFIRSSLAIKKSLSLANGVGIIDADYYHNPDNMGEIIIAIKNNTDTDYEYKKGDKIAQGIFMKYLTADGDEADAIRIGGIGSTDR